MKDTDNTIIASGSREHSGRTQCKSTIAQALCTHQAPLPFVYRVQKQLKVAGDPCSQALRERKTQDGTKVQDGSSQWVSKRAKGEPHGREMGIWEGHTGFPVKRSVSNPGCL